MGAELNLKENEITPISPEAGYIKVFPENGDLKLIRPDGTIINLSLLGGGGGTSLPNVITVDPNGNQIVGLSYTTLENAVDFCNANADTDNRYIILVTKSLTLSSPITLSNPFYSIRGLGVYETSIFVDDSLAGGAAVTYSHTSPVTRSPLGGFNLIGSATLANTPDTIGLYFRANAVSYIDSIRIEDFYTNIEVDSAPSSAVVLFANNISTRGGDTGMAINNGTMIADSLQLVEAGRNFRLESGYDVTVNSSNLSGFTLGVGTCLEVNGVGTLSMSNVTFTQATTGAVVNADADIFLQSADFEDSLTGQHVVYNSPVGIRLSNVSVDITKVTFNAVPDISGSLINTNPNERSFVITDELHVGLPNAGEETTSGKGDAYVGAMLCYTFDGSSFVNVTEDVQIFSDGNTVSFPNNTVGNAIYFSNLYGVSFPDLKLDVDTPSVLGAGNLVYEYWDGTAWVEFNTMDVNTQSPYLSNADGKLENSGSRYVYFDDRVHKDWIPNNPVGLGQPLYWARLRISATVNQLPSIDRVKIGTDHYQVNKDGFNQYHGNSRPIGKFPISLNGLKPAVDPPDSVNFYRSDNVFFGAGNNSFRDNRDRSIGGRVIFPFDFDSSCPIRLHLVYRVAVAGTGTVVWDIRWDYFNMEDLIYTSTADAPTTTATQKQIIEADSITTSQAGEMRTAIIELDAPEVVSQRFVAGQIEQGDLLAFTIGRLGTDAADTKSGNVSLVDVALFYTRWRDGGHIDAE